MYYICIELCIFVREFYSFDPSSIYYLMTLYTSCILSKISRKSPGYLRNQPF